MNKIYLGSHVSMSSPDFYLGSVRSALEWGENTFMFYTGAPQNSYRLPLERLKIEEGRKLLKENNIDESKIIVHAPYLINLGSKEKIDNYELAKKLVINELQRTKAFGCKTLVLHPGNHLKASKIEGLNNIVEGLNYIFENDNTDVKIALETMSGKGSELGTTFEDINYIINNCKYSDRLGVCLDTCHINDYGYDVRDIDHILDEFNQIIGLEKLLVVHVNDSKNPIGAHKDRHDNIGYGTIGFETLSKYIHHPLLINVPKILETPYVNEKPPYKKEVEMLLNNAFEDNWRENL
ncbi:MAG: deoxyribonuclease IV [Bacillales bacterium]|nr:deoxyribonuclease IV [Bacillales bacterium]